MGLARPPDLPSACQLCFLANSSQVLEVRAFQFKRPQTNDSGHDMQGCFQATLEFLS